MAKLSIIIPTFNEEKLIERTLLAVKEATQGKTGSMKTHLPLYNNVSLHALQ